MKLASSTVIHRQNGIPFAVTLGVNMWSEHEHGIDPLLRWAAPLASPSGLLIASNRDLSRDIRCAKTTVKSSPAAFLTNDHALPTSRLSSRNLKDHTSAAWGGNSGNLEGIAAYIPDSGPVSDTVVGGWDETSFSIQVCGHQNVSDLEILANSFRAEDLCIAHVFLNDYAGHASAGQHSSPFGFALSLTAPGLAPPQWVEFLLREQSRQRHSRGY